MWYISLFPGGLATPLLSVPALGDKHFTIHIVFSLHFQLSMASKF